MEAMSNNQKEIDQKLFDKLTEAAYRHIPTWSGLSTADPIRIILESVAEFAGRLHAQVRPETERLFETLPEFLGIPNGPTKPVSGFVIAHLATDANASILVPSNTPMHGFGQNAPRRFVTVHETELHPIQLVAEHFESGWHYCAFDKILANDRLALTYLSRQELQTISTPQVQVEVFENNKWRPIDCEVQGNGNFGQLTLALDYKRISMSDFRGLKAFWLRVGKLDTNRELQVESQPIWAIYNNAIQVESRAFETEKTFGHALGIPCQAISLPVTPLSTEFEIFVEGDRHAWRTTPDLSDIDSTERVFQYDRELNRLVFGNGVSGRIPLPIGARIYAVELEHLGNQQELPADSIHGFDEELPGVTKLEQIRPFFSTADSHHRRPNLQALRDQLWGSHCLSTVEQYEIACRSFSPGIRHAQAKPNHQDPRQIEVIVSGPAIRTDDGEINHELLIELQSELRARQALGQQVNVRPAKPRHILVELQADAKHCEPVSGSIEDQNQRLSEMLNLNHPYHPEKAGTFGCRILSTDIVALLRTDVDKATDSNVNLVDAAESIHFDKSNLADDEYPVFKVDLNRKDGAA